MQTCGNCLGLIGESGRAYGYVGKWCHCASPRPLNDYPKISGTRVGSIKDLLDKPPGPVVVMPKEETLTPAEFVFWLRGYLAASGEYAAKRIADELAKVKT